MKFPVFSLLAGNLAFSETSSQLTPPSSKESPANLIKGEIERPSDFDGVVYISLDDADWQMRLGRELQAAGYKIDWNKAMR